ncbi:MAG: ExeA family protein [Planctomycetota bacterium]|jgi:type II secretory pathway predicted ATPase ExeA
MKSNLTDRSHTNCMNSSSCAQTLANRWVIRMVESFFGLSKRPFHVTPNPDSYVPTNCCNLAIENSIRCVLRAEGPSLIIAGAGLGKSICSMMIARKLSSSMQVALLASSQLCTRRALLQSIHYHLGLPYQETSEGKLRISLQEYLCQPKANPHRVVLVIDEAQTLSVKLLDELRLLTNSVSCDQPCVHLVLAGTLKLEDTLAHPQMESLNQRIVSREYLTPLSHSETLHYIQKKIELAGADPSAIFEPAALDAIFRASDGIPRLIEQLADQAILQSGTQAQKPIPASRIGAVWTQLHQLPNPWSEPELTRHPQPVARPENTPVATDHDQDDPPEGVIEFGSLDSLDLEPQAINLFQAFIEDPPEDRNINNDRTSSTSLDDSFRQLIKNLNLAAIQLQPNKHAFSKAKQPTKQTPKPVASADACIRATSGQLVGVSVDGDDRDMIVLIEEQDWVSPFAIR